MASLSVEVTLRCNNACVACAQGDLRSEVAARSVSELRAEIASAEAADAVHFVGGEPTLSDDLLELVGEARSRGVSEVLVQTNGRRLSVPGYAEALVRAGVTSLDVSLHGTTEEMHDYHTRSPGSFKQTVTGLRRARAAGLPFTVSTVVTRSNFRHLSDVVRLAHVLGAKALHLEVVRPLGNAAELRDRVCPHPAMVRPHLTHAARQAQVLGLTCVVGDAAGSPGFAGIGRAYEPPKTQTSRRELRRLPVATQSALGGAAL